MSTVDAQFSNPATVQLRSHALACTYLCNLALGPGNSLQIVRASCQVRSEHETPVWHNPVWNDTQLSLSVAA